MRLGRNAEVSIGHQLIMPCTLALLLTPGTEDWCWPQTDNGFGYSRVSLRSSVMFRINFSGAEVSVSLKLTTSSVSNHTPLATRLLEMGGNYTLPMFVSYGLILAFILLNQVHIQSQTTTPSCQPHQDPYPTLAHQQGNNPGPNLTQSPLALTMNCQLTPPPLQPPWGQNPGPTLAYSLLPSMKDCQSTPPPV